MPPRLTARSMFWWGVVLVVTSFLGNDLLTRAIYSADVVVSVGVNAWLAPLLGVVETVGAMMVAGSLVVRALGADDTPARAQRR